MGAATCQHEARSVMQDAFHFSGNTFDYARDHERLGKQMRAVMDYMLDHVGDPQTFWSIQHGIVAAGGGRYPEASISARLRDMRNKYGFRVDCRYVENGLHTYEVVL